MTATADGPSDLRRLTDQAGRSLACYVDDRHGEEVWADWCRFEIASSRLNVSLPAPAPAGAASA